ncbi:hypothetical protein VPEG_00048 [Vibrio phage SIO-2]|uniref:hypothetical protein n=1 Tax=Vibrio phage SIO-2 TaxID=700512 RepID=UPI0002357C56|nr:hypothetical protein VPEG_00048 [Vibrio phage SIO-2]AET42199.1 hypothetical protein VPEG_00048 [Vibrio phage SIO-2]
MTKSTLHARIELSLINLNAQAGVDSIKKSLATCAPYKTMHLNGARCEVSNLRNQSQLMLDTLDALDNGYPEPLLDLLSNEKPLHAMNALHKVMEEARDHVERLRRNQSITTGLSGNLTEELVAFNQTRIDSITTALNLIDAQNWAVTANAAN